MTEVPKVGAASNAPDVMITFAPLPRLRKPHPVKLLVLVLVVMFKVNVPETEVEAVNALLLSRPLIVRFA